MKKNIRKFLPLLLIVPMLLLGYYVAIQNVETSKPKVIIRFDDYGVWCNQDWIQIEEEIIRLHEKYNVKLTYAVIPESRYPLVRHTLSPQSYPAKVDSMRATTFLPPLTEDSQRVIILRDAVQKGVIEVALHGYYHPKGYSNTDKNTEYYNIPYDTQYWKLNNGKNILDSLFNTNVTTLVPPHNTYDNLTLDLIQEFGFNCISAKQNSFDAPLDDRLQIRYLWYTTADCKEFFNTLKRPHYTNEPVQILMLHHTNFTTDGVRDAQKILDYEELLQYISDSEIPNYTFAEFPSSENKNNELYYKALYQSLISKGQSKLAEKVTRLSTSCSVIGIIMTFLIVLMMAIGGIVYTLLNVISYKMNKTVKYCIYTATGLILLGIIFMLFCAYRISIYNLYYCLLTAKLYLLLCVFAILSSLSAHCLFHKD